jgi:hypothetical protein
MRATRSDRVDTALRIAEFAGELDRRGDRLEAQDRDEVAALLGHRPAGWRDADAALERLIETASGEGFADLVRLLHRRTLRQEALLCPAMRELTGVEFQRLRL